MTTNTVSARRDISEAAASGVAGSRFWNFRRVLALALMLVIPITLMLGSASGAFAQPADEDEEDAVAALNFYRLSSSVTALFSEANKPDSKVEAPEGDTAWQDVASNASSGGSFVGYVDDDYNPIAGWMNSKTAQSSDAIGYNTLIPAPGGVFAGIAGAQHYGFYGATLQGLGLDTTSTGLSLGFFNTMLGGVVMLLYILGAAVDGLFSIILTIMDWLNPYRLFYVGVNAVSPEFANGMTGGQGPPGFLGSLAEWIGGWYQVLNSLSWTVLVPIFMATFIMGILLFKKMDKGSGLKKLFIRLLFIGLGLPLLGSMYTGALGAMNTATDDGNAGSTKVVLSTYVDFEGWALDQRLRIPEGATIEWHAPESGTSDDRIANKPSGAAQAGVRDTALLINAQVFGLDGVEVIGDTDEDVAWGEAIRGGDSNWSKTQFGDIVSMLFRYMANEQVSASAFETESKATLRGDALNLAPAWFEGYIGDPEKVVKAGEHEYKPPEDDGVKIKIAPNANPLLVTAGDTGLQMTGGGNAMGSLRQFETAGEFEVGNCGRQLSTPSGKPMSCNLAPLAMYNYLNTDFGSTSLHSYSSGRSSSEATRSVHNSVSMVGTGTMSFIYWFNAVVLLGSFVLIGFGYAFAMIMGNLRRGLQLVTAIPFATLGAIAGIAKVIVYSIALIMEVIITIFLYKFVQEFLLALPSIFEKPFSGVLNNGDAGEAAALVGYLSSSGLVAIIITLAAIVFTIMFTVMALRLRKSIVKAVEEASTKIIEKFMDTSAGPGGGGGGMMPALAGGAAAGAGAAIGNRMMNGGGGGGGKKPGGSNTGGTNGPSAISSGDEGPDGGGGGFLGGDVDTDGALDSDGTMALEGSDSEGGAVEGVDAEAAEGSQGSGSPMGASDTDGSSGPGSDPAGETELGKQVESSGLSNPTGDAADGPDSAAESSGVDGGSSVDGPAADGSTGGNIDQPVAGDGDAMDAASGSMQDSADGYKEADQAKMSAGTEGAQAVGHGAAAVGRGVAGDGAGAAKSAGDAADHGGQAASADAKSRQASADAGKSSLDSQNTQADKQRAQQMKQGQQVSGAGKTVSGVAGAAGGVGGGSGGKAPTGGGKTPSTGGKAPAPSGGKASAGGKAPASTGGKSPAGSGKSPSASGGKAPASSPKAPSGGSGGGQKPPARRSNSSGGGGGGRSQAPARKNPPAPKQAPAKQAPKAPAVKPPAPRPTPPKPTATPKPTSKSTPARRGNTGAARDGVRKAQNAKRRAADAKRRRGRKGGKKG